MTSQPPTTPGPPPGSIFGNVGPPPMAPAGMPSEPAPAAVQWDTSYPSAGHDLLARHHNVHGGLDVQLRRLGEVLGAHAAVIARVLEHAGGPDGSSGPPTFWGTVVEAMKANHGALRMIEQDAEQLLTQHAGVIAAVERFL